MGWFDKDKKEEKVPELPELPKLPELPDFEDDDTPLRQPINQLPSYPSNTLGDKFSQNTIKEAVTGKKEVMEDNADDQEEHFVMPQPPKKMQSHRIQTKPIAKQVPQEFEQAAQIVKQAEPIFIRIDKFEESLKTFEKAKGQVAEIEGMLKDIKTIKDEEEKELEYWEKQMKKIKEQIERVDQDIFSKVI